MPQVPKYGPPKVDASPMPAATRQYPTATYESAGGKMGEALMGIGGDVAKLADQVIEQARVQRAAVFQADMRQGMYDLEAQALTAPDTAEGVKGILNQKGLDPHKNMAAVLESIDTQAGELGKQARSPAEQAWFTAEWARVRAEIQSRMRGHASSELQQYQQNAFTALLKAEQNRAGLHAPNGAAGRAVIADALKNTNQAIDVNASLLGLSPDEITNLRAAATAQIHANAVTAMLDGRQHREAAAYWAGVREWVQDAEVRGKIDGLLKQRTTEAIAFDVVNQIMREHGPKTATDVISIDVLEAKVREQLTDPDEQQAGITQLRSIVAGIETGRKARLDQQKFDIWSIVNGAKLADMQSGAVTRAIDATQASKDNPEEALRAKTFVQGEIDRDLNRRNSAASRAAAAESREASRDARALQAEEREQRRLERDNWATYYGLATTERLATLTEGQILALIPTIGERHVTRLMQDLEQYRANLGRLDSQTVDRDLLNDLAVRAGLTYFAAPSQANTNEGKTQRANVAKFVAAINDEIKKQQRDPKINRPLSREEQRKIITDLLDAKVTLTDAGWFFYDAQEFAILVDATTADAFVPWDTIPEQRRTEYLNWFAGDTVLARLPQADKQRRIERAWAIVLSRGTLAQVQAALKGEAVK